MIVLMLVVLLLALPVYASDVVVCQTGTDDGLAISAYLKSVNTPDFSKDAKNLINPDVTLLRSVSTTHWKCSNAAVMEMTQTEKDTTDAAALLTEVLVVRADGEAIVDTRAVGGVVLRAFALVVMDEFNVLRNLHALSNRTIAQLKAAIKDKISAGDAD